MPGQTRLYLGGVPLAYVPFEWRRYRGMTPEAVIIQQPAGLYGALRAMATSLNGKPTTLRVDGPDGPGKNPGTRTVIIEGVFIESVTLMSEAVCVVTMYDRRWELTRRVMDKNFNVVFGEGKLNGTAVLTYRDAINAVVESVPVLKDSLANDALLGVPELKMPDDVIKDGMPLLAALQELGQEGGFDLTVTVDGKYRWASRGIGDGAGLPPASAYSWQLIPGWAIDDSVQLGRPRAAHVYYRERHNIAVKYYSPKAREGSISHVLPGELRVELEQVYSSNGEIYTLKELLEAYGYAGADEFNGINLDGDLSDLEICNVFMSENFDGTNVEADGSANARAVIEAVRDGWRRLFRIKFPDARGNIGGWTDWDFGRFKKNALGVYDGSVDPIAASCRWVEFLNVIDNETGQSLEGMPTTINHGEPSSQIKGHLSPFMARWETGPEDGVIRLVQREIRDGNFAMPGELVEPLRIIDKPSITSPDGGIPLDAFRIYDSEDRATAEFKPSLIITIYLVATRRMPNDETRWHDEVVPGYDDGDVDVLEMPPGDKFAVRDWVDTTHPLDDMRKFPSADGFGVVLNKGTLTLDAERRFEAWKHLYGVPDMGSGTAEGLAAFQDVAIDGDVLDVSLSATIEGAHGVQVVRTRINAGPLADAEAIDRIAGRRVANRKIKEAGKEVGG